MYFNCIILCSSSLLFFFPNFACVWCSCFGFSSLCWCARELRKSIELKLYREKQHIYRYTNSHTRHTHILALARFHQCTHTHALSPAHKNPRNGIWTREKKIVYRVRVWRDIFVFLFWWHSKWNIYQKTKNERETRRKKKRGVQSTTTATVLSPQPTADWRREQQTHGSCLNRFKQMNIIEN